MVATNFSLRDDYWETFELVEEDVEVLYNHLLETETPLTSEELLRVLVKERVMREKLAIEKRRSAGGEIYFPKIDYEIGQTLIFPALGWLRGDVLEKRSGKNPNHPQFNVLRIGFEEGNIREFASGIQDHRLNDPPVEDEWDSLLSSTDVLAEYGSYLTARLESGLENNQEFVRIAGKWFPRALLVEVNVGHLNLAEAVLDMEGGGPIPTAKLLETVELPHDVNRKLVEFSLDYALWNDPRFDEIGPAGEVLWFLRRLEPEQVLEIPQNLNYQERDYDRSFLTQEMLELERELDDELSPLETSLDEERSVEIRILYPHWRIGSLPLSSKLRPLFPTAYQAPRIRFMLVDGDTGNKFPGWVVREYGYVYGLREFYLEKGVIPGSLLTIRPGENQGEVVVDAHSRRPVREWIRTVLVGSDEAIVLAMLKQIISTSFDERMAIAIPDAEALDTVWIQNRKNRKPFERVVVDSLRELAKLNPQGHVHASELYAVVNLVRRCPPGPILALLASRPWFIHVGDLHFRFDDSEHVK
jgi:hypothetical protein